MKILLANKFFYLKGGAEISFFETAKLLEDRGHKVISFSMEHTKNLPSPYNKYFVSNVDYEKSGIKNKINASLKLLYSFEAKNKIKQLIEDEKPDIAHLNNIYHQISPSIIHALKQYNIPIVMSLRDYKIVCASYCMLSKRRICEACKKGRYYHCLLRCCVKDSRAKSLLNTIEMYLHHKIMHIYELVDIFISPSQFLKFKLEEMGFERKIVHLPNFVNIDNFRPQFSWRENSIVYFGRLTKEKGLFALIDAMKNFEGLALKIIGEGPIKTHLESKVRDLELSNVKFLGYRSGVELKDEIKRSMFVVLPSEWHENNPRSIIEAFSLGKPAIGARIGGIPELVKDGITGLTFEPGNVEDLKSKIEYMLDNRSKIIEMGRNARKLVEEEYNAAKHYQKLMEIYKRAIEG